MLTASRILGTEVGSTAPVFLAFLAVHVVGGLTAVASGAIAAIARKGSPPGTSARAAGITGPSRWRSSPRPSWPRCAGGRTSPCSSSACSVSLVRLGETALQLTNDRAELTR